MQYTFSAKRVYRNFHALLKLLLDKRCRYSLPQRCLQKFPCNSHLLKKVMVNSLTLLQESIEISMRCLNFVLLDKSCRCTLPRRCLQKFSCNTYLLRRRLNNYSLRFLSKRVNRNFHVTYTSSGQVFKRPRSFATSNLAFSDV